MTKTRTRMTRTRMRRSLRLPTAELKRLIASGELTLTPVGTRLKARLKPQRSNRPGGANG